MPRGGLEGFVLSMPKVLVPTPTRPDLEFGLFAVAPPVELPETLWEQSGVEFESFGNPVGQVTPFAAGCGKGAPGEGWELPASEGTDLLGACAFGVQATAARSLVGYPEGYAREVAVSRLLRGEETVVETLFDTGSASNTPNLSGATALEPAADLAGAVALLERVMGDEYGERGVFHANRETVSLMLGSGLAHSRGGRVYSMLGTPVVAGVGYDFSGLKLSPAVSVWRSQIYSFADSLLADVSKNDQFGVAQRYYAVGLESGTVFSVDVVPEEG